MRKIYKKHGILVFLPLPIIILVVTVIALCNISREYREAEEEYSNLAEEYATGIGRLRIQVSDDEPINNGSWQIDKSVLVDENSIDFASLQQINADVIGWITIPCCDVNYPIVQGSDNDKYLTTTYEGKTNSSGTIFMDYANSSDFSDMNTFIYGHNMKNNTMFGSLKKLRNDPSIINAQPYFYIFAPDGKIRKYQMFSVRIVEATSEAYRLIQTSDSYEQYINECLTQSKQGINKNIKFDYSPIVTLSTCTGSDGSNRLLIHGVLIATY